MNSNANITTGKWVVDAAHSELNFRVRHLMISNVKGGFANFNAEITGDDLTKASINVSIDAASVTTGDEGRDVHLRSADFFDAENHKEIVFQSTDFKHIKGDHYKLEGLLTIKGNAHPVELDVEFGGINTDPWGNTKAGYSVSGKINRKHWGLNWNAALEAGGVLVSDEVKIDGEIQLVKQKQ